MEKEKKNIESILAERVKLDEILKSEFTRKVTIMFTDIKGSTSFYEQRGDFDGRLMVHRHNELVLPVISQNRGVLIKTIGDATMSLYEDPTDGVRAALQIQQQLREYNAGRTAGEQINVRIGLNTGLGIVEEKDVFGDVVNVAARVESLADGGEIFVTEDTYKEVKNNDEFIFRFAQSSQVRGKKEALKAYRLVWNEAELLLGKTRKAPQPQRKEGLFVLDASVAGGSIKVSGYSRKDGEERAVKNYREVPYQEDKVRELTRGITDVLNRANQRGKIGNELLVKLKEQGAMLFDQLVPVEIKESLKKTEDVNLMLAIDDRLVHVPWELLYDGKDFLCQRFSIGRSVSTKQAVSVMVRSLHRPLKMQVLADPRGDLSAAYEEGVAIKNEVSSFEDWLDVSLKTTEITTDYAKAKIRNFDIVHYAGHAEHNTARPEESGWLLKDGSLRASEVMAMAGSRPMPALVFSNACQTGQTDAWKVDSDYSTRIFGMANAFLLSGVQHYIGTFWEIPDEAGALFARAFYRSLVGGTTIGEALRAARRELIEKYGEDTIVWASYMLYGDPTTRYVVAEAEEVPAEQEARHQEKAAQEQLVGASLRGGTDTVVVTQSGDKKTGMLLAGAAVVIAAVVGAFVLLPKGRGPAVVAPEQAAPAAKQAAPADAESRKRIDELVASLAQRYREGKIDAPRAAADAWSSQPLTMVFMDIKAEGGNASLANVLVTKLSDPLQSDSRIQLVEREMLSKLLEELKLSSSSLADPATALKIGKLLSARVMVTGSILPEKRGQTVVLRFIDTETTAVRKVLTEESASSDIDREFAQKTAKDIIAWTRTEFPVQGRIVSVTGETCLINLGQAHGLKKSDRFDIVKESRKGSGIYKPVGELEITEVSKDKAEARIISKAEPVKDGAQIRQK